MEELNTHSGTHKMIMVGRKTCTLSGVKDVLSFDIHEILLETEQGMLMIRGEDLHVNRLMLEQGEIDVDGRIDSFTYSDASESGSKKAQSFISRLFQ